MLSPLIAVSPKTVTYTYDAENRLSKVSVTGKDGKTAVIQQNRYNGDGQRIQKVEGSKTTNYYYQDGVVSYTTDGDNSQISQNLIGTDGNILATQRYGSDHTDYLLIVVSPKSVYRYVASALPSSFTRLVVLPWISL